MNPMRLNQQPTPNYNELIHMLRKNWSLKHQTNEVEKWGKKFLLSFCLKYFWQVCFHLILAVNILNVPHSKMKSTFSFFQKKYFSCFTSRLLSAECMFHHILYRCMCAMKLRLEAAELSMRYVNCLCVCTFDEVLFSFFMLSPFFWFVVFIILLFLLCIMYDYYPHSCVCMRMPMVWPLSIPNFDGALVCLPT